MIKTLLITIFFITSPSFGQYVYFSRASNGTNQISIPSGEIWQAVNWRAAENYNYNYFNLQIGGSYEDMSFLGTSGAFLTIENAASSQPIGLIIAGPAILRPGPALANSNYSYYLAFKKIISSSQNNNTSSTAVVIPTSATGDVDVKLEQSADNMTWTECLPGTYNSSTVKRFFRLRAVEK